jgi:hypothetical protein
MFEPSEVVIGGHCSFAPYWIVCLRAEKFFESRHNKRHITASAASIASEPSWRCWEPAF